MTAGPLKERIAFDQRVVTVDGYGNEQGDWQQQFIRSARLHPRLGGEQVMASRLQGIQPYTITVRYDDETKTIETDWRARNIEDGKVYAILGIVNPDERKRWIELEVRSGSVA
jgi:SPP1 family predicted phage head-tail adaptor